MKLTRRNFIVLTATFAAGCSSESSHAPAAVTTRVVNAGPLTRYASDGVYTNFRDQGFFIIRNGPVLTALSAICTHRKCKLNAEPNQTFTCPCHGSKFDANGYVTSGPARRDLSPLATLVSERGELLVIVRS